MIVRGGCDNGAVLVTRLDTRQAIAACLDQWRRSIVDCDDAELPERIRDIESVSWMAYSVMLDTVAELESRDVAVTAGFGTPNNSWPGC